MKNKNRSLVKCKSSSCNKLFNEKEKNNSYRNIGYGKESLNKIRGYCNSFCAVEGRNEEREKTKQIERENLMEAKDRLIKSATNIYQSLTKVVNIQRVEVTSKLLGKIRELVDRAEIKNK